MKDRCALAVCELCIFKFFWYSFLVFREVNRGDIPSVVAMAIAATIIAGNGSGTVKLIVSEVPVLPPESVA
ncbi:MAG: hypothetical protein JSW44_04515 [Candidatus Bathyarchaeota archaeon]|nr:MAG: hypothetical protein JSW44_04515 [Candidatus Bathyarchaeota archaeon]